MKGIATIEKEYKEKSDALADEYDEKIKNAKDDDEKKKLEKEWEDKDDPNLYHKAYKSSLTGRGISINSRPLFNNCDKLKTVIIPEGIKAMPEFSNCKALDSISLPSTVEYLSENAFNGCASLKEVNIPVSVEKIAFYYIGEWLTRRCFTLNRLTQHFVASICFRHTNTFS